MQILRISFLSMLFHTIIGYARKIPYYIFATILTFQIMQNSLIEETVQKLRNKFLMSKNSILNIKHVYESYEISNIIIQNTWIKYLDTV